MDGLRITTEQIADPVVSRDHGLIGVEIDSRLFGLSAVLRTAYKFADRCHIFIQNSDREFIWLAMLRPKTTTQAFDLAGDFSNELIDQRLRQSLEEQFGNLRTLIVAQAFSEGNLLDEQRSEGDYIADPGKIATPR
jgi:His-Xaa-Ser system protein HxsD